MIAVSSFFALLSASPACTPELISHVAAELPSASSPWLVRCLDDSTLELARVAATGVRMARSVRVADVSSSLRLEMVSLASLALMTEVAAVSAPPPPPSAPAMPLRRGVFVEGGPSGVAWRGGVVARLMALEETWLLSGQLGLEWRWLQVALRGGAGVAALGTPVRTVALEAVASLALVCTPGVTIAFCARVEATLGAANIALTPAAQSNIEARSGWTVFAQGAAVAELLLRSGRVLLAVALLAGATVGPRAVVAQEPGPAWAGLTMGAAVTAGFE